MVPDVSGIDKVFDYIVPERLHADARAGVRVRVDLHGRRVGGWIVALGDGPSRDAGSYDTAKLVPLAAVSGEGVDPSVIDLARWTASRWYGSWRAVLSSATAPRTRLRTVHPRHGSAPEVPADEVATAAVDLAGRGGGLLVVPPLASALNAVAALAARGPVLAVCPTQRMAVLGAAALRRRGFTTALAPDDWEAARAGVDVVIGARSSVWAPCAGMSAVVVVDEHDELLHEERAPTWNAVDVARERASRAGVPCIVLSAVPSASSMVVHERSVSVVSPARAWPVVSVVDLESVPVHGSLLSSEMLESIQTPGITTVCVLNTKGKARLLSCRSCRELQRCPECTSLLSQDDDGVLACARCGFSAGTVCTSCGRTAFAVLRGGTAQLLSQVSASSVNPVVEVTADTDDSWTAGNVFIGTEAVLYRIPRADCVVFADIDRDLSAPRVTAPRETLALIARAARLVGSSGRVIVQTRQPSHALMRAIAAADTQQSLLDWCAADVAQRRVLELPPFTSMVRLTLAEGRDIAEAGLLAGIGTASDGRTVDMRAGSRSAMDEAVAQVRAVFGTDVRVHADPRRY